MMSRSYHGCHDDSLSDAVFSEEESGYRGWNSPFNHVFSPNTSMTSSLLDVYSPRELPVREAYSPAVSNYSTYSQEVKYIFDPNFGVQQRSKSYSNIKMQSTPAVTEPIDPSGNSIEDDYSHIQYPSRKPSVQRKGSNSSQLSYKGQGHSKNPPPPPPRTSSSASSSQVSQQGDATLTPRKSLTHSMSASYSSCYYPNQQGRRRTWSPEGLKVGYATGNVRRAQRLRSYSNEQLMEGEVIGVRDRDHIYEELEAGPPKLAPISGMLNRVSPVLAVTIITTCRKHYLKLKDFPFSMYIFSALQIKFPR